MVGRPLAQALEVAETVAAGDLTSHIEVRSNDETGRLMGAMKQMNESLVRIGSEVCQGTDVDPVRRSAASGRYRGVEQQQPARSRHRSRALSGLVGEAVRQEADHLFGQEFRQGDRDRFQTLLIRQATPPTGTH
jgi:methyl-accepting chemotaxis protein